MSEPYHKDMSNVSWDEVFARQSRRAELVESWMDELQLEPGNRVLDVGAGPGYLSLVAAERVGPSGLVYAVDRSAEALAYLERLQRERGVAHIERIVADAEQLRELPGVPDAALATMVLHHADDPLAVLAAVVRLLPSGGRAIVAEFHPDGPGEHGPPSPERLAPDQVRVWCEQAGFEILTYRRQTPEHYMLLVQKG
jgi:ubiquinone/menaquinone biosynthesis C-methylase UbiE